MRAVMKKYKQDCTKVLLSKEKIYTLLLFTNSCWCLANYVYLSGMAYIKCLVNSLVWKQVNRGWRVKNSGTSYEYANTAFQSHLFEGEGAHSTECKETHSKLSEAVCY